MTTLRWLAADDRIAHAVAGRSPRTLCGIPAVIERFAWPEQRRCIACDVIAKREAR